MQHAPTTIIVIRLGQVHSRAGDLEYGVAVLEQWWWERPDDIPVVKALAEAYHQSGELEAARAIDLRVLEHFPNDAPPLNNLATTSWLCW